MSPAARRAMVDAEWAWPTGAAIRSWRAMVRRGLAAETTGECEGCASRAHRPGQAHVVPVFRLLGVRSRAGDRAAWLTARIDEVRS